MVSPSASDTVKMAETRIGAWVSDILIADFLKLRRTSLIVILERIAADWVPSAG